MLQHFSSRLINDIPSFPSQRGEHWMLEKKMLDKGIDKESISDWFTGKRSMSQIAKAMFYFYLSK